MLLRFLLGLALVVGTIVFLTGAWNSSIDLPAPNAKSSFRPQTITLDADIVGSGVDAVQLLHKAADKLGSDRVTWLKTKIRQTMTDADSNFVAEGFLQRGPNHCARLELTISSGGDKRSRQIVSDGELLAQVSAHPDQPAAVDVHRLPDTTGAAKEAFLNDKGCGGPHTLLQQLHRHLQNGRLQTGLLDETPVIQIKGDLPPDAHSVGACTAIVPRHAYVYVDAKTLWPRRIEWWGIDKAGALRPVLQIEFLEPELNRALSAEECARVFSCHVDDESH